MSDTLEPSHRELPDAPETPLDLGSVDTGEPDVREPDLADLELGPTDTDTDDSEARVARRREYKRDYQRDYRKNGPKAGRTSQLEIAADIELDKVAAVLRESQLQAGMLAIVSLFTDAVHLLALETDDPRFGEERAEQVAKLWVPILAPYLDDAHWARHLPIIFAGVGTAHLAKVWANEVAKSRTTRPHARVVPIAKPEPDAQSHQATTP